MRDFELPGRSVAVSRNGMAATSHPLATLTAVDVLRAGGNAIDAAIAACAVQCVVEAGSTGIGGDCFALFSREGSDRIVAYNGSGRTPAALTGEHLAGQGLASIERACAHAVTVPGAVDAWDRLARDFGRLPLGELLAPAVKLARDGYAITPRVAADIAKQRELLVRDPTARRLFLADGEAPEVGTVQRQAELADTLDAIGRDGRDAFYRGDVAADMVTYLRGLGGVHTLDDFSSVAGEYVRPIQADYRGWTVHECPPNGQGIIALLILKILARFTPKPDPLDPDNLHREIEATRLAYAARDRFLADPDFSQAAVDHLLSDPLADELAARVNPARAIETVPAFEHEAHSDTVYISVVDAQRNAVSFINSIFHPYGSGLVAPRSGVLFHNRGQSFSLERDHPNALGPGKRPMHTIIPGMVSRNGRVVLSFGVMGGHYQAMGHAHLLSKIFDHGLDLQSAIDLPRLFPLPGTRVIEAERRLRDSVADVLTARGFEVKAPQWAIGGAQAIRIDWETGTLLGGSDHRKDGCALGY